MKVSTLIKKLSKCDPEATVLTPCLYMNCDAVKNVKQKKAVLGANKDHCSGVGEHIVMEQYNDKNYKDKSKVSVVVLDVD